jgi:hypothetical protein
MTAWIQNFAVTAPMAFVVVTSAFVLFLWVLGKCVVDWLASPVEPADNLIDFRRRDEKPDTIYDGWSPSEGTRR